MRRLLMTTAAAALMFVSTVTAVNRANAMPLGSLSAVRATIFDLNILDRVQYFWGGKRYCWYDEGWNGSGWYWCGYSDRPKLGWGGPKGFRGWVAGRGTSSGNAA